MLHAGGAGQPLRQVRDDDGDGDAHPCAAEQARAQDDRLRDAIEQGPDGHRHAASGPLGLGGLMAWPGALAMPGAVAAEEGVDQDVRNGAAEAAQKHASQPTVIRRVARMPCPPRAAKAPATAPRASWGTGTAMNMPKTSTEQNPYSPTSAATTMAGPVTNGRLSHQPARNRTTGATAP